MTYLLPGKIFLEVFASFLRNFLQRGSLKEKKEKILSTPNWVSCLQMVYQDFFQRGPAGHAFELFVFVVPKGNAQFAGHALPRQKMKFGGVHQDAVQVKKKAADHARAGCRMRNTSRW